MNYILKELPIDERIRLVEDLWDSIAADQLSTDPANIRETIRCHFNEKEDLPKVVRLHFLKDEIMVI